MKVADPARRLSREIISPARKAAISPGPPIFPTGHGSRATVFDNCRESSTNPTLYAKQSQFPKRQNQRNLALSKGLRQCNLLRPTAKQTQYKPNQSQNKPNLPKTPKSTQPQFPQRITKMKPPSPPIKTNPIKPKANPIFGPSGPPKAKTNPIYPGVASGIKPNFYNLVYKNNLTDSRRGKNVNHIAF